MNKFIFALIKSNIKKAIWDLECVNKLRPNTVDEELINKIKLTLSIIVTEHEKEVEENC